MKDVTSIPLPQLSLRAAASHKGDYGRVLVIGGSRGMAGAPSLAGMAALRSGAGLVTLAVPRSIQQTVAGFEPSYMTIGLGDANAEGLSTSYKAEILAVAQKMSAVAIGPGLGSDTATAQLVCELYQQLAVPMIVDADALNALAKMPERLEHPGGVRILTPHPGEFYRLTDQVCGKATVARAEQATSLSQRDLSGRTIVVLKGHQTIIANSEHYAINGTGNPGLATGGTGDCLTGIITALVAQGLNPWDAARLGAHIHGLAGDLAAAELGQVSLIASDLISFLPTAFQSCITK